MPTTPPVLVGQLVALRPIEPARDARSYYDMCLPPEMHTWTGNDILPSVDEARRELERLCGLPGVIMWAVAERESARLIGRFFIRPEAREDGRLVVGEGNRIAMPYWRRGHNREARSLVSNYVFARLHADVIESECWSDNANSRLSLLAHGFECVRRAPQFNPKHGRWMEKSFFELTRRVWHDTWRTSR